MAEKLKQALKTKGMSQVAFATACGVSKQAVQSWIKTGRIDKKHLPKFVEVLGLPLGWWLEVEATTHLPATALTRPKLCVQQMAIHQHQPERIQPAQRPANGHG